MPTYYPHKEPLNPIHNKDGTLNKRFNCVGSYLECMNVYRDCEAYIAQEKVEGWCWLKVNRLGVELTLCIKKGQNEHRDKLLRHVEHVLDTMVYQPPKYNPETAPNETYFLSVGMQEWNIAFDKLTWSHDVL